MAVVTLVLDLQSAARVQVGVRVVLDLGVEAPGRDRADAGLGDDVGMVAAVGFGARAQHHLAIAEVMDLAERGAHQFATAAVVEAAGAQRQGQLVTALRFAQRVDLVDDHPPQRSREFVGGRVVADRARPIEPDVEPRTVGAVLRAHR